MKKVFILNIAMVTMILIGCQKEPVVLEFDDSYSVKPPTSTIKKDSLPPVDLLTVYAYFSENEQQMVVNRLIQVDKSVEVDNITPVSLDVKTTIPVETETTFKIKKITNEDKVYPTIVKGLIVELPSGAYSINNDEISFKEGDKTSSTTITFDKDVFSTLDKAKTYVIPIKLEVMQGTAKIVNYFVLQINLQDVKALPQGNNVSVATSLPIGNSYSKGDLSFSSNYQPSHLYKLNDGSFYQNWWTPSDSDTWLTIGLRETKKVNAISITTYRGYWGSGKTLKSIKVFASQDNGVTFVEQGIANFVSDSYNAIIVFDTPIEINKIKLTDFVGYRDWIDIHEIELQIVE